MSGESPRAEYARRLHRVLEHIDRHLSEPLDLPTLAEVAHFSPFHFHRVFAAWMGETLGEYIRRRRLEVGALRLLIQPRSSVLQVALTVGFGSGEAFTRAFRARFACSPTQWRRVRGDEREARKRNLDQALSNPDQAGVAPGVHHRPAGPSAQELPMSPSNPVVLVDRTPVRVAYLRHVGPYGAAVGEFFAQRFWPFVATHGLEAGAVYGISHDNPEVTAPERCRFDACVEVDAGWQPVGEAQVTEIPGGRYASLHFHGTSDAIGEAWATLLRDWLPSSGYQIDGRPTFELYPPGGSFEPATGRFSCDILIPVAPL